MASNPWEILNSSRLNVPGLLQAADQGRQQRLQELMLNRQMAREDKQSTREDAALGRQDKARSLVASGAKPEEVMGQDLDIGKQYAEYRKTASAEDVAQHERQANATIQAADYMKTLPKGLARTMQWQQMKPQFAALGVAPDALDKVDPNDDTQLDNYAAQNRMFLKAKEDYTLDGERFSGITNKVVASSSKPRYQEFDPTHTYVPTNDAARNLGGGGGRAGAQAGSFQSILAAEGGTNPDGSFRTSPAGAVGPAQVMPGTGPEAAQLAGLPWDEQRYRSDQQYNLALGQAYHAKQLSDFGDPALAAAAYNAGPGRVRQALEQGGPQGWINHVPAETRAYVQKVMGSSSNARGGDQTAGAGAYPPGTIIGKPKADPNAPPDAFGINPGLTGQAALEALPAAERTRVQQLIDGRSVLSAREKGTPYGRNLMAAANQVDSTYDETTYANRGQARASFAPRGKDGANIVSALTLLGHVDSLESQMGGTWSTGMPAFNAVANYMQHETGGAGADKYTQTAGHVAEEASKFFRGVGGGAESDIKRNLDDLKASASDEQKHNAISNLRDLIQSRFSPLAQAYETAMGKSIITLPWLKMQDKAKLAKIMGEAVPSEGASASSGAPPGGKPIGTYKGKAVYQMPNGDRVVEQ